MHLGLVGHGGNNNEPFEISVGGDLDRRYLSGPVDKDRIEDLQIYSALYSLNQIGAAKHPLGIEPAKPHMDPPDRWIVHGERRWATELTVLSIEHIRKELGLVRQFGRQLEQRLRDKPAAFSHLQGCNVMLANIHDIKMPRDYRPLLDRIEHALEEDKGFFGQGMDFFAKDTPDLNGRGMYGDFGPFFVQVNKTPNGSGITVLPSRPAPIFQSDAITALGERIAQKDKPSNELLVITCGLPDDKGYVCPQDHAIFQLLHDAIRSGFEIISEWPKNIQGILIHRWNSQDLISCGEGDFPWTDYAAEKIILAEGDQTPGQ